MRRTGYMAAAAVGLIAPLAIALPAFAGTSPPALPEVGSITQNDWDDNGNDNDWDDNDWDDNDWDDNNDDNGDDNNDDGDVRVAAAGSSGDLSILLSGSDLDSRQDYSIDSPGLDAACEDNDLTGQSVETGRTGNLEVLATTEDCIPGTYDVVITDESGNSESIIVDFEVD